MADYNLKPEKKPKASDEEEDDRYLSLSKIKDQYFDYLHVKSDEVEEGHEAEHYYHCDQWTDKEIDTLRKRRQPVITFNREGRKIDAVVGLVERLKQDPKAYSRSPNADEGAEIATAVLRYCIDKVDWQSKYPRAARMAAIRGYAGVELDLAFGDHQDPDIDLHLVNPRTFFYDPRSIDDNFTDARYMGISKWIDIEQAKEIIPAKEEELEELAEQGTDMTTSDRDQDILWMAASGKKIRLVDHWYINRGKWFWCLHCGSSKLLEGESPFIDERGKSFSKFLMFSCAVDAKANRYGFHRNFKGPQDEINMRRSKGLHILNSRRLIGQKGAVDDVEKARTEWARPDGYLEINPGLEVKPDDAASKADMAGHFQLLQEAKNEIENFGPNPALIGQGIEGSSGRAISLLQQAGIAELGPYMVAVRTWRIRVYRSMWQIVQRYWSAERWIRVTDDEGLAQFIQVNGLTQDQFGQPAIANHIGSLDVDIILDEGPDNVNMMADAYDTLLALVRGGQQIPPEVLIELAPLQNSVKQKLLKKFEAAANDPMKQQAKQIALAGEAAKNDKTHSETVKNIAQAQKLGVDSQVDMGHLKLEAFKTAGQIHQAAREPSSSGSSPPGAAPSPAPVPASAPQPLGAGPVPGAMSLGAGVAQPQPPLPTPGLIPPGATQV